MILLLVGTILWRTQETIHRIQTHTQERNELMMLSGTTKTSSSSYAISSSDNATTIRGMNDDDDNTNNYDTNNDTNGRMGTTKGTMVVFDQEDEYGTISSIHQHNTKTMTTKTIAPIRRFIRRPSQVLPRPTRTIRPSKTITAITKSSTTMTTTTTATTTTATSKPRWKDKMALGIRERKGKIRQAASVKEPVNPIDVLRNNYNNNLNCSCHGHILFIA
jgi:hypothetical protein